jgi:ubiquinone/menaquinone biosynthesis C-methylase UbiE
MYFPKRIAEPKIMEQVEMKAFDELSKSNFARWIIPLVDDFMSRTKLRRGKVLDVACGPGLLAKGLAESSANLRVVGLDLSKDALRLARRNCKHIKNASFKIGSVYKMPFNDEIFDAVICKDSFHHFDDPKKAIEEMLRVVRSDGCIYIQDLRRDLSRGVIRLAEPRKTTVQKLQYYSTRASYTTSEVRRILKDLKIRHFKLAVSKIAASKFRKYVKNGLEPKLLSRSLTTRFTLLIKK